MFLPPPVLVSSIHRSSTWNYFLNFPVCVWNKKRTGECHGFVCLVASRQAKAEETNRNRPVPVTHFPVCHDEISPRTFAFSLDKCRKPGKVTHSVQVPLLISLNRATNSCYVHLENVNLIKKMANLILSYLARIRSSEAFAFAFLFFAS